jgi:hypothetical protein
VPRVAVRPVTLVEGRHSALEPRVDAALASARIDGWAVVRGWAAPLTGERIVSTGIIATADDARRTLPAAMAGDALVAGMTARRATVDRFLDELRSLGTVGGRGRGGAVVWGGAVGFVVRCASPAHDGLPPGAPATG